MSSFAVASSKKNMSKLKTAGVTTFQVFPADEKNPKQWLAKCKFNFSCMNKDVYSVHCTDDDSDLRNELLNPPPLKKPKSDSLLSRQLPMRKTGVCVRIVEAETNRTLKKEDKHEKNLVNVKFQGSCALNTKGKATYSVQDTKYVKSSDNIPYTGASGCPMAMKGKMRYELVATDWKPPKTEPSVGTPPTSEASAHTNGNFVSLGSPKSPTPKPVQPIKKCRLSTEESEKSGDAENDDDIRALEEEIIELQEYNAKVESEMIKLRTDITQMEQHIRMTERDNQSLTQKSHRMSEYYESLRNNFISLLDQVRLPNFDERPTHDNFDTYLNKLQSLCADSCREENKAILSSVKQALQDFPLHLTSGWLRS